MRWADVGLTTTRRAWQWPRLEQNFGADALLEHVDRCDVDGHGEDLFGLATKGDEIEERPIGLEINEKVDVSCSVGVTASQ